jgi:hypothetical protein
LFSIEPIPGNPWPHDMMIRVDDDLQSLLELLWVREAWQLHPIGDDLPPALVDTPIAVAPAMRRSAPTSEWEAAWTHVWEEALQHAGTTPSPDIFERLQATPNGSPDRARLLRELVGPSWREEVGGEAFTDEAEQWMQAQFEQRVRPSSTRLEAQPERLSLEALIEAWKCGLTTVVQIPCRGTFTRRIGPHAILVTAGTRADPERYAEALRMFC